MEPEMIVDLHAHVVPRDFPELDERIRGLGVEPPAGGGGEAFPPGPA
jgi:hypothetical protein